MRARTCGSVHLRTRQFFFSSATTCGRTHLRASAIASINFFFEARSNAGTHLRKCAPAAVLKNQKLAFRVMYFCGALRMFHSWVDEKPAGRHLVWGTFKAERLKREPQQDLLKTCDALHLVVLTSSLFSFVSLLSLCLFHDVFFAFVSIVCLVPCSRHVLFDVCGFSLNFGGSVVH